MEILAHPNVFLLTDRVDRDKTCLYKTLYHLLQSQVTKICTKAYTGIPATLLPRGKTVHKTFELLISLFKDSSLNIGAQSQDAAHLRKIDAIFRDGGSMAPRHAMGFEHRTMLDVTNNNDEPFGEKILIMGGDSAIITC